MQALGLIETRGLIAAVESADAMLKAAEVRLLERTLVGGGLVTIAVTGDVGAVKAAVEAGAAAVSHLNSALLISEHVIPRPHSDLDGMIVSQESLKDAETEPDPDPNPDPDGIDEDAAGCSENEEIASNIEEDITVLGIEGDAAVPVIRADEADLEINEDEAETEDIWPEAILSEIHKEDVDKRVLEHDLEDVIEVLSRFKVLKLRNLAREYKDFGIAGRLISKADKKMLLAEFRTYYGRD